MFALSGAAVPVLALAAWLAAPVAAHAADAAAAGAAADVAADVAPDGSQDIIVSAERRATSLQSTALAISVMSSETLERANVPDITNLNGQVSGLPVTRTGGRETTPTIRGIGANTPENTG